MNAAETLIKFCKRLSDKKKKEKQIGIYYELFEEVAYIYYIYIYMCVYEDYLNSIISVYNSIF